MPVCQCIAYTSWGMKNTWVFNPVNTCNSLMGLDKLALHWSSHMRTEQKTRVIINAHLIAEVKKTASWDTAKSTSWDKDWCIQGLRLGPELRNVFPCWALLGDAKQVCSSTLCFSFHYFLSLWTQRNSNSPCSTCNSKWPSSAGSPLPLCNIQVCPHNHPRPPSCSGASTAVLLWSLRVKSQFSVEIAFVMRWGLVTVSH